MNIPDATHNGSSDAPPTLTASKLTFVCKCGEQFARLDEFLTHAAKEHDKRPYHKEASDAPMPPL